MRPAAALSALALAAALPAAADEAFPATLLGHAFAPALSLVAPPADAPRDAWISGKFTGPAPNHVPMSRPGDTGAQHGRRPTGLSLPFIGQPYQGWSGFAMERDRDGAIYVLTDNGFGSKANSPDALLFFSRISPDWETGKVDVREVVFLHDPDRKVPFRIAYEGTESRYLTGADFDPEGIQVVANEVWIGDEFGPWLIRATLEGRVIAVYPTKFEGQELRSVDHPAISGLSKAGADWRVTRSSGYEGLAYQPEAGLLWGMLEKPILNEAGEPEGQFLRVLAFDPGRGDWTGQSFKFALAEGATAIGDFNFIDATRALVIERDNGEGDPSLKCAADPGPDCFPNPAMLKRVTLIDTAQIDEDGFVKKLGHIDLMNIADPEGKGRIPTAAARDLSGIFTFPFFTIESVMLAGEGQIAVAMDNNLPFSSGRALDRAADNEIILLSVPELLSAR